MEVPFKIAEYFSVIKPFEGFGSKKTPRPYANNSVVRVVKLRLFPSPPRALDSCTCCRFFGGTCISKKSWDYTIISYFLGVLYCYMHCPYFISLKLRDFLNFFRNTCSSRVWQNRKKYSPQHMEFQQERGNLLCCWKNGFALCAYIFVSTAFYTL